MTLAYVLCDVLSIEKYKKDFLSYLGGRNNVFCGMHRSPLIASTTRDLFCSRCGDKKEFYKCCTFNCKMCLCKDCLDTCNQSVTNYVRDGTGNVSQLVEDDDNVSTIDEDDECSSNKTGNGDDSEEDNTFENLDNSFDDNFEDFVVSTSNPDLQYGDEHKLISANDPIPTTNAAEEAFHIRDTVEQWPINRVSEHVILNQCGSLLSWCNYEIKGSSKHQFFLKKIHATSGKCSVTIPRKCIVSVNFFI